MNIAKAMKVEADPNRAGELASSSSAGIQILIPIVISLGVGGMAQGAYKIARREWRRRYPSFNTSGCYGGINLAANLIFVIPIMFSSG